MNPEPLLTVCIPAYNRASLLAPLLKTILNQEFDDFEVLICEDGSPERAAIVEVVQSFQQRHPGRIHCEENATNLGYDGNIRRLVERAHGQYCLFMGNDDLLCQGALASIAAAIQSHPDCGVVVRSYASFEDNPDHYKQVFRYFPEELTIPAGEQAVATAYRRSVVISGMVIHRESALAVTTTRFDGTLLYQLYLVGMVLATRSAVFLPQIITLRRDGTPPDFGNSAVERENFVPHDQTPESSIHFMRGMLTIAQYIEMETQLNVFPIIRADIGNYAYPILSIQAQRSFRVFVKYGIDLAKLGLWRSPLFHLYFVAILILGTSRMDRIIHWVKSSIGYTPKLGTTIKNQKN